MFKLLSLSSDCWAPTKSEQRQIKNFGYVSRFASAIHSQKLDVQFPLRVFAIGSPDKPMVNGYAIANDVGAFLMIDSGVFPSGDMFDRVLQSLGLHPSKASRIFFTHGDIDHVANAYTSEVLVEKPKYISSKDAALIKGGSRSKFLGMTMTRGPQLPNDPCLTLIDSHFEFSDSNFPDMKLTIIPTPGHTEGSVAFRFCGKDPSNGVLYFTGDALRLGGRHMFLSRTDMNRSANHMSQKASLLKNLKEDYSNDYPMTILTGHTGITNDVQAVIRKIENY